MPVSPGNAHFLSPKAMEYRQLGSTGLRLSALGFGCSPLGSVFGPVSDDDVLQSVRAAIELGINFFDVSPYYGNTLAEANLGKALKTIPRDKFIVSTKCGRYGDGFDFSAERVTKSVDESLHRLNLDYIDIIQCHDIEFGSLDQVISETIPALQALKKLGKVRFIGITGLPLKIFRYVLDKVEPGTIDVVLSYCHYALNDDSLLEIVPYLKSKGVGIINASPLSMGLLTESGPPVWHPAPAQLKEACRGAAELCKSKGGNVSELALKFSLKYPEITSTLIGMNSPEQVHGNVRAFHQLEKIDAGLLKEVEGILAPVKNLTWPSGLEANN